MAFFAENRVYITVWKSLWKMCKTFENTRKIMGDNSLWENLRKNISGKKAGFGRKTAEKGAKWAGCLNLCPVCDTITTY